jgi:hypothetical protein
MIADGYLCKTWSGCDEPIMMVSTDGKGRWAGDEIIYASFSFIPYS